MTGVLIDNINIILQVKTPQLDRCKRSKIQLSRQKYNFSPVTVGKFRYYMKKMRKSTHLISYVPTVLL